MKFKIKKHSYRLFSVLLSLVMIVISVPISASAELSSDDATEASESVQSENLGKIESEEISLPINPAEMTAVTDDVITDGVYAFRNVNNPNMWLDTGFSSPLPDSYMQQYAYPTAPNDTNAFYKGGLFKIKCMSTANPHYVIRLMTNNELIFRPNTSTSYVHSLKVSPTDTAVPSASRYLLQKTDAGYIIKLVGSPYCIATPQSNVSGEGTVASRLTYLSPTEAQTNTRAQWQLYKYEGTAKNTVVIDTYPPNMYRGNSYSVWAYVSCTTMDINGPVEYSVSEISSNDTTKATIDLNTGRITANTIGQIKIWAKCAGTSVTSNKTVGIYEGSEDTYILKNAYHDKYIQQNDDVPRLFDRVISNEQQWKFAHIENGYFKIISVSEGTVLTAPTTLGAEISLSDYSGSYNQQWMMIKQTDGSHKISPRSNSSYYLSSGAITSSEGIKVVLKAEQTTLQDAWYLSIARDATLVALPETYDRSSYFPEISDYLYDMGYTETYHNHENINASVTEAELLKYISSSKITLIRTHGNQSSIVTYDGFLTNSDMLNLSVDFLDYSELIIYGACETGLGGVGASNLVNSTYSRGATTVIGFEKSVYADEVNIWCIGFFLSLSWGDTIWDACKYGDAYVENFWYDPAHPEYQITTDSWYIAGDKYATLS